MEIKEPDDPNERNSQSQRKRHKRKRYHKHKLFNQSNGNVFRDENGRHSEMHYSGPDLNHIKGKNLKRSFDDTQSVVLYQTIHEMQVVTNSTPFRRIESSDEEDCSLHRHLFPESESNDIASNTTALSKTNRMYKYVYANESGSSGEKNKRKQPKRRKRKYSFTNSNDSESFVGKGKRKRSNVERKKKSGNKNKDSKAAGETPMNDDYHSIFSEMPASLNSNNKLKHDFNRMEEGESDKESDNSGFVKEKKRRHQGLVRKRFQIKSYVRYDGIESDCRYEESQTRLITVRAGEIELLSENMLKKAATEVQRALVRKEVTNLTPEAVINIMRKKNGFRIIFESQNDLLLLISRYPEKFKKKRVLGRVMISARTDIEICSIYSNNQSVEHTCGDLHICKYYMLSNCQSKNCKFSHDLNTQHNRDVLRNKDLGNLKHASIKFVTQNLDSRNTSTTPFICKFYNNLGGCKNDKTCTFLNMCLHYINGNCKYGSSCKRSHNFRDPQPRVVLARYGIRLEDNDEDAIKCLIQETLCDDKIKLKRDFSKTSASYNIQPTASTSTVSPSSMLRYNEHSRASKSYRTEPTFKKDIDEVAEDSISEGDVEVDSTETESLHFEDVSETNSDEDLDVSSNKYELDKNPDYIPLALDEDKFESRINSRLETKQSKDASCWQHRF